MCEAHLHYSVECCVCSVRCGTSACIHSAHMSVVAGVVLFVQVVCVGTLSCGYICTDCIEVRIDKQGSVSAYIILRRVGLICMGWNVPAVIGGNCKFSFMGLCVPT